MLHLLLQISFVLMPEAAVTDIAQVRVNADERYGYKKQRFPDQTESLRAPRGWIEGGAHWCDTQVRYSLS